MGRAEYFHRAIQAAGHILEGFDQEAFLQKVGGHRVAIAFDASAQTPEGQAALDLLVRLIARFYPFIGIVALDEGCDDVLAGLKTLARQINPKIGIAGKLQSANDIIAVGRTVVPARSSQTLLYLGSDGWVAHLSRSQPVGSGASHNPLGAGVAACLAAANVFRGLFTCAPLDNEVTLSALDLDPTSEAPSNPGMDNIDIGNVFLVGAGAIGNGFLWAMSRCPMSGRLTVVEHDQIDLGNMQRYVLTRRKDEGSPKVTLVQRFFEGHGGIALHCIPNKWEEFVTSLPVDEWRFDRVVVALDSPEDRIAVQSSLPRWVVNGWTQKGEMGVSRHGFIGDEACMACLYMPTGEAPHEDQLIAQALGFPPTMPIEELRGIRTMIETGQPLDRGFLQQVANAKSVALEKLLPFEGKSIRELYTGAVCSGMVMELATGPATARAEVPMPFQSALAGILQAASLITHAGNLRTMPTITQIDLMKPLPRSRWLNRPAKKAIGRCFCQDSIFQEVYTEKYPA